MKLYADPISTTCRPILLLAAETDADIELNHVDLFKGAHREPSYAAINPNCCVPALADDDLRLTESSAILKYLAEKLGSPSYPKDLKERARVNAVMDWFNTGFYRDFGYGFVYPQIFPHYKRDNQIVQEANLDFAREKAKRWLDTLDKDMIGAKNKFLLGDQVTIADYFGACLLSIGEIVHCDFSPWPNVSRWQKNMEALPQWERVNRTFNERLVTPMKDVPFVMF